MGDGNPSVSCADSSLIAPFPALAVKGCRPRIFQMPAAAGRDFQARLRLHKGAYMDKDRNPVLESKAQDFVYKREIHEKTNEENPLHS